MTKSQNTKNEQLTEQWKKGELPEGFYYVSDGAEITIDYYLCDYWERHFDSDVTEVLAPVPSYDEWIQKCEVVKNLLERNETLVKNGKQRCHENTKLKEEVSRESYKVSEAYCLVEELKGLLEECRDVMNQRILSAEEYKLLTKIDEVLKW